MALIRDFEMIGTGLVVPNAYHVIIQIDIEKRMSDRSAPQGTGRVYQGAADPDVEWTAGYYGRMVVCVWKDAESRESHKNMLGVINADYKVPALFRVDTTSTESYLSQAYAFLKTTDYYATAVEA